MKAAEDRAIERGYDSVDDYICDLIESDAMLYLDGETLRAINEAEAEYARGLGIPIAEAFAQLRRKHFEA